MDIRLSSEQQALRDSVAQVSRDLGPRTVAGLDDLERAAKLEAAVAASGWRELRGAENGRAPLASGVEAAIVAEELGRGLVDVPFLGPTLAAELRRLSAAGAATSIETVALAPTMADLAVLRAGSSVRDAVAIDCLGIDHALVLLAAPDAFEVASLSLATAAVGTDLTRWTAPVDPAASVKPLGPGLRVTPDELTAWNALALALTSAELVGTMRGAIDLSVEYAAARRQFGRPIGSFQAVQHLLADAFVLAEGARSVALHAAWAVDALAPSAALGAAAVAKAYCARAARSVGETAIQVHGGIGNTWECLAHVHLRRALFSSAVLGGADASLDRVLAHHGIGGRDGLQ